MLLLRLIHLLRTGLYGREIVHMLLLPTILTDVLVRVMGSAEPVKRKTCLWLFINSNRGNEGDARIPRITFPHCIGRVLKFLLLWSLVFLSSPFFTLHYRISTPNPSLFRHRLHKSRMFYFSANPFSCSLVLTRLSVTIFLLSSTQWTPLMTFCLLRLLPLFIVSFR